MTSSALLKQHFFLKSCQMRGKILEYMLAVADCVSERTNIPSLYDVTNPAPMFPGIWSYVPLIKVFKTHSRQSQLQTLQFGEPFTSFKVGAMEYDFALGGRKPWSELFHRGSQATM